MASITTSLEVVINNLCDDRNSLVKDRVETARENIFDFEYCVPEKIDKDKFKKYFETMFLYHFMFEQIGYETYGQFKIKLISKCMEIMPEYSKIIDSFYLIKSEDGIVNHSMNRTIDGTKETKSRSDLSDTTKNETISNGNGSSEGKNLSADLPENLINAKTIYDVGYADKGQMSSGNTYQSSTSENNGNRNSTSNGTINDKTLNNELSRGLTSSLGSIFADFKNGISGVFTELLNEFDSLFLLIYY